MCQLAAVAMNLLRLIGQNTFNEPDAPVRHRAKRSPIKTVMQALMFKAACVPRADVTARKIPLILGKSRQTSARWRIPGFEWGVALRGHEVLGDQWPD
jgi:hypothetical protein